MAATGVYCDKAILKEIKDGHIIIEPFNEKQLNNCSYNVTLSEFFFREKQPPHNKLTRESKKIYLNPWCERHVANRWEQGKVEIATDKNAGDLGLNPGEKYVTLAPFETILIATLEFVGGRDHITSEIRGRSSGGRALLSVCGGAGWGDVGYTNRWTLMVTNLSRWAHLVLPIGCSIAQIIFLECGKPRNAYNGKYQNGLDSKMEVNLLVEEMNDSWTPAMMLPQLFKEKENKEHPASQRSPSPSSSEEEDVASFHVEINNVADKITY